MSKYKHLFWDLDHTLWDFEANSKNTLFQVYEAFQLKGYGIADFDAFSVTYEMHNEALWVQLRAGTISRSLLRWKRMDLALNDYGIANEPLAKKMSDMYLAILPLQTTLLPHALEVLDYCRGKGYSQYLITNGFETTQQLKLANSGLESYFLKMITSEQVHVMKPHAPIFHYALETTHAQVENSIMIGDSLEADILGAMGIGMDQIYYNPLLVPHKENVTYEVQSLQQIIALL